MSAPQSFRVLIAGNGLAASGVLRAQLDNLGHQVVSEVAGSRDIVQLTRRLRPDLVVVDLGMADPGVLDAGRQIGQDGLCPIIVLASDSDPSLLREACALPVHAYLVKPVEERELGPAIELAVERFRQFRRLQNQAVLLRDILSTRSMLKRAAEYVALCEHCPTHEAQQRIQNEARAKRATLLEVADAVLRQSTVDYRYSVPI